MRRGVLLSLLFVCLTSLACGQTNMLTTEEFLEFLTGQWRINDRDQFEEWKWENDTLEGKSYKIVDGRHVLTEELEIIKSGETWIYNAQVPDQNNGNPVSFSLVKTANNQFVFENAAHDFPNRITYSILDNDHMSVLVSDLTGKGFSLKFSRE